MGIDVLVGRVLLDHGGVGPGVGAVTVGGGGQEGAGVDIAERLQSRGVHAGRAHVIRDVAVERLVRLQERSAERYVAGLADGVRKSGGSGKGDALRVSAGRGGTIKK